MADLPSAEPIILDTHAWLWLLDGDRRLEGELANGIEAAAAAGALLLSAISIWEVAMLEAIGRLRFSIPVQTWLDEATSVAGLTVVPVDVELAAESASLPAPFPGDGCDRLIVATARLSRGELLTADPALIDYAGRGHLRVVPIA